MVLPINYSDLWPYLGPSWGHIMALRLLGVLINDATTFCDLQSTLYPLACVRLWDCLDLHSGILVSLTSSSFHNTAPSYRPQALSHIASSMAMDSFFHWQLLPLRATWEFHYGWILYYFSVGRKDQIARIYMMAAATPYRPPWATNMDRSWYLAVQEGSAK